MANVSAEGTASANDPFTCITVFPPATLYAPYSLDIHGRGQIIYNLYWFKRAIGY